MSISLVIFDINLSVNSTFKSKKYLQPHDNINYIFKHKNLFLAIVVEFSLTHLLALTKM